MRNLNFNNNEVLVDFITFFRYVYFPYRIYESSHDPYGGFDDTLCDENGEFSVEKASKSEIGRRLAKIQGLDVPTFDYVGLVRNLPSGASEEYKALLATDLLDAMEKMFEHNLVFYFPVLDRFIGKNREESIAILREHVDFSKSIGAITSQTKHLRESIETIVQDYQQSEFDSFIDYFRSLENYVLEHPNNPIHFGRWGKSFNLIEDSIIRKVEVSYDSLGFSQRKEKETLFSTVYNVLSSWQWAVGESNDWQWMHDNAGGDAISELWHKSDNFIVRDIDWESSYFSSKHRLFEAYKDFLKIVLHECLLSTDLSYIYHISPFTPVKKLYSFEDEDVSDFVKIINKYLINRSYLLKAEDDYRYLPGKDNNNKYIPDTFLNKWLGEDGFNICQSLIFEVPLGLGFSLRLNQGGYEEFLSDVGHGITQIVSILLSIESVLIENEVLELKRAKKQETISAPKSIITIEEPEVSLHPRFQSMLADMLYDASMKYGDHVVFLVETHSEYLVRRMQAIVSNFTNDEFNDNPFVVYYFEPNGNVYDLKFKKSGRFENSFGPGFLDESAKLKYILRANAAKNLNED